MHSVNILFTTAIFSDRFSYESVAGIYDSECSPLQKLLRTRRKKKNNTNKRRNQEETTICIPTATPEQADNRQTSSYCHTHDLSLQDICNENDTYHADRHTDK